MFGRTISIIYYVCIYIYNFMRVYIYIYYVVNVVFIEELLYHSPHFEWMTSGEWRLIAGLQLSVAPQLGRQLFRLLFSEFPKVKLGEWYVRLIFGHFCSDVFFCRLS